MVEEFTNPVPALVESGQWLYNKPVKAAGRRTSQKCRQDVGQGHLAPQLPPLRYRPQFCAIPGNRASLHLAAGIPGGDLLAYDVED